MQKNITEFFNNLNELSSTERAALSHCVRKYLGEDQIPGSALAGFYKSLPVKLSEDVEPIWFACACLSCLWRDSEELSSEEIPLEEAVAQIIPEVFPLKHRMELLLKSLQSNDSYFLSSLYPIVQHVRQQSPETRIDFGKLLEDLLNWENPEHEVQKRWTKNNSERRSLKNKYEQGN